MCLSPPSLNSSSNQSSGTLNDEAPTTVTFGSAALTPEYAASSILA